MVNSAVVVILEIEIPGKAPFNSHISVGNSDFGISHAEFAERAKSYFQDQGYPPGTICTVRQVIPIEPDVYWKIFGNQLADYLDSIDPKDASDLYA